MQDFYFTHRDQLEVACARLASMRAPQLPLYRAAADGRVRIINVCAADAAWPTAMIAKSTGPTAVVVGADQGAGDDPGPHKWRAAKGLRRWCAAAIVHGAGGETGHYRLAVDAAETFQRLALIECTADQVQPWTAFLGCPRTLMIVPRDGVHPVMPPREALQ